MPYAATPPITQPSIGLAHAPKYTSPHSAKASNCQVPVNFSTNPTVRVALLSGPGSGLPAPQNARYATKATWLQDVPWRRRRWLKLQAPVAPCGYMRRCSAKVPWKRAVHFSPIPCHCSRNPLRAAAAAARCVWSVLPWKRHGGAWSFSPESKLPCTPSQIDTRCTGCAAMPLERRRSRSRKKAAGA